MAFEECSSGVDLELESVALSRGIPVEFRRLMLEMPNDTRTCRRAVLARGQVTFSMIG